MSMIDFELYKLFYTVAKYGSLSKAAEELFISQPAASQSIKRLEELLCYFVKRFLMIFNENYLFLFIIPKNGEKIKQKRGRAGGTVA